LEPVIEAAIERWSAVPGLSGAAAALRRVPFEIVDLPGLMVGQTIADTIVIDPTAAAYGWFIDTTPMQDEEFLTLPTGALRRALDAAPAAGELDLLTVVMHELGHVLGLGDVDTASSSGDLMATALPPGIRRLPGGVAVSVGSVKPQGPLSSAVEPATKSARPAPTPPVSSGHGTTPAGLFGVSPTRDPSEPTAREPEEGLRSRVTTGAAMPGNTQAIGHPDRPRQPELVDALLSEIPEGRSVGDVLRSLLGRIKRPRR
jgi:hypothetical protein